LGYGKAQIKSQFETERIINTIRTGIKYIPALPNNFIELALPIFIERSASSLTKISEANSVIANKETAFKIENA